ncbi:MAG: MarR family transcriptional regulator, partial [Ruminococcus sp.]|nr:MarR family transcriptional regulator [Ruminococcus sp.]
GAYTPYLKELDLTYTQYISMLVLWEHGTISVKDMGRLLHLDSGTLTPVLKKLEQKGFIERRRDSSDERVLNVSVTEMGLGLRDKALCVPEKIACTLDLTEEEVVFLYGVLHKLLGE